MSVHSTLAKHFPALVGFGQNDDRDRTTNTMEEVF